MPLGCRVQEQEWVRDVAIVIVDLDFNVLPAGSLDDYVGNAIAGLPVILPPAGPSSFRV